MAQPTQVFPPWLTPSASVITNTAGVPVSTETAIVYLPLTYFGPSIPLGSLWTFGGSTSPAPSSTPLTTTIATPASFLSTSASISTSNTATPFSSTTPMGIFSTSSSLSSTSVTNISSSSSTPSTSSPAHFGSLTKGQLVGAIIASILGLIFVFILFLYRWCKDRKNRRQFATLVPLDEDRDHDVLSSSDVEGYRVAGDQYSAPEGYRAPGEGSPHHSSDSSGSRVTNSNASGFGVLLDRPTQGIGYLPSMPDPIRSILSPAEMRRLHLDKFFPPNDPFLQILATKANALREDPTTDLGKPENIGRLTCLSLYQIVIYCDDSESMAQSTRYRNQRDIVTRIARIATKILPDDMAGVDLRFINSAGSQRLDANAIERAIDAVTPCGGTKIGTQLRKRILKPLVYDVISTSKSSTTSIPFKRPLLICAITDGCPYPEPIDTLMKEVLECKQKLVAADCDPIWVMFLISQVGTDDSATEFLDTLRSEPRIQDVVYVTAENLDKQYEELRENERKLELWLLHLLTRPIMDM